MPLLTIKHRPQEVSAGCLAACAQMALDYINVSVAQRRLNRLFEYTSMGVPWPRIERLAQLGVQVTLQEGEETELRKAIARNLPPIIFVRTGELTTYWNADLQHAVLMIGYDATSVFLNDPAFPTAPQQASWGELMLALIPYDFMFALITPR